MSLKCSEFSAALIHIYMKENRASFREMSICTQNCLQNKAPLKNFSLHLIPFASWNKSVKMLLLESYSDTFLHRKIKDDSIFFFFTRNIGFFKSKFLMFYNYSTLQSLLLILLQNLKNKIHFYFTTYKTLNNVPDNLKTV